MKGNEFERDYSYHPYIFGPDLGTYVALIYYLGLNTFIKTKSKLNMPVTLQTSLISLWQM